MEPRGNRPPALRATLRSYRPAADAREVSAIIQESAEAAQWGPPAEAEGLGSGLGHVLVSERETPTRLVGFIYARQVADDGEILNIAVRPSFRRQGVGEQLLNGMLERLRSNRVTRVFLEVRESNAPAIALYEKHGFVRKGRRRGYYSNPPEDALVFERKLQAEEF